MIASIHQIKARIPEMGWRFLLVLTQLVLAALVAVDGCGSAGAAPAPAPAPAQMAIENHFALQRWTLEDGLPESQIAGVVMGQDGYLWLATARSLARFDGRNFTVIKMPPQASLGRNEGLLRDRDGGLWVYGYHGAMRYAGGEWLQGETAGLPRGRVAAITQGEAGVLYFAQGQSIHEWNGRQFREIFNASKSDGETAAIHHLAWIPRSGLWIALGDKLIRCLPGGADTGPRTTDISAEWILHCGVKGELIAHGSFVCLRRNGDKWDRFPDGRVVAARCLLETSDGTLWVGHDGGLDCFLNGVWLRLQRSSLFDRVEVNGITEDCEGNVWAATSNGLIRLRKRVFQRVDWRAGGAVPQVSTLWVESNERVMAGLASGGLATGDARGMVPVALPPELAKEAFTALYREKGGRLWCATANGELWTLDGEIAGRIGGLRTENARVIMGAGEAPIWVGTRRGILGISPRQATEDIGWPLDPVLALWLDRDSFLWAGHESMGLGVQRSGARTEFFPPENLPGNAIHAIYRDSEGILWIGGRGGLARWDGNKHFIFRNEQGLWSESIRQIAEDASGALWLGTATGILRIGKRDLAEVAAGRKELLSARSFGREVGMEDEECIGGVAFPHLNPPRDQLWFPTRAGLLTVDTRQIPPPRPPPAVHLVRVDSGSLIRLEAGGGGASTTTSAEIGARELVIDYSALDFATPDRVRFRYTISGPVEQISEFTRSRKVTLSRLPPGAYSFRVVACNGDGVWLPAGADLKWEILPYFWEKTWLRVVVVLGVAFLVAAGVWLAEHRRARLRLMGVEHERAIEHERARIARDLHDDIGAKLTRLSLLGAMAIEDTGPVGRASRPLMELSNAARETHRAFDEIVWSVNPRDDTLRSLAHYICKYAEEFFDGTPVACRCHLPPTFPDLPLLPLHRHHLFLAVKEGLQNMLKHAAARQVEVRIVLLAGGLRVELGDDGSGFEPESAAAAGDGLRNMQERMDKVGGTLGMSSRPGAGTRVIFEMPVNGLEFPRLEGGQGRSRPGDGSHPHVT